MLSSNKILVIDDDDRIRELLVKFLAEKGFDMSCSPDTYDARKKLENDIFDLIIVDIMMPNETGIEFTESLRKSNNTTSILMLTAMGEVEDIVKGFETGADDYLPKPFDPRELLVRINSILNRANKKSIKNNIFKIGDEVSYDFDKKLILNSESSHLLSSNEFLLLEYLIKNKGKVVSREELAKISGGISERSIDVQITRLRSKLELKPKEPKYLKTIRNKGYMLV